MPGRTMKGILVTCVDLRQILLDCGHCKSKMEVKRLVRQGAVDVNGEKVNGYQIEIPIGTFSVLKVGKRFLTRITPPSFDMEIYDDDQLIARHPLLPKSRLKRKEVMPVPKPKMP